MIAAGLDATTYTDPAVLATEQESVFAGAGISSG